MHGHAREDHWEPTAGQTTRGTDGKSCKQPVEIAPQGDGTEARKDGLVHSLVVG